MMMSRAQVTSPASTAVQQVTLIIMTPIDWHCTICCFLVQRLVLGCIA